MLTAVCRARQVATTWRVSRILTSGQSGLLHSSRSILQIEVYRDSTPLVGAHAKLCRRRIFSTDASVAQSPSPVRTAGLAELAMAVNKKKTCSKEDIKAIQKGLLSDGVDMTQLQNASRCLRYIHSKDGGAALSCVKAITTKLQELNPNVNQIPVRRLLEILMCIKQLTSASTEVKTFLSYMAKALNRSTNTTFLNGNHIGGALFALRFMSSGDAEVRAVVSSISRRMREVRGTFSAQNIGNSLYGLRSMSSQHREVRMLLAQLSDWVATCNEPMTQENVGSALYGLRLMRSDAVELRYLLNSLYRPITSCQDCFTPIAVGNALYGLGSMRSDVPQVCSILAALKDLVASCDKPLKAQHLSNSLYGLRNMNSDVPEVCALLGALVVPISKCTEPLKPKYVANAMYGLRRMSSSVKEVGQIVSALKIPLSSCTEPLTVQDVGSAMYGMRRMNSIDPEVREVLPILKGLMETCKDSFTSKDIGSCINGLRLMNSDHDEVRSMLPMLTRFVSTCKEPRLNGEIAGDIIHGFQYLSSDVPEVRELLLAISGPGVSTISSGESAGVVEITNDVLAAFDGDLPRMDRNAPEVRIFLKELFQIVYNRRSSLADGNGKM